MESAPTGAGTCGACLPTRRACASDQECGTGNICVAAPNPSPCQCMGPDTACAPRCTASSCLTSETCGDDGRCAPLSCKAGFTCPSGTVCDPARATGHGCAVPLCDVDQAPCGAQEVCDPAAATPNHCRAKRCSEGVVCPTNFRCGSGTDYCQRKTCTVDAECDCGACVNSACQAHLFTCVLFPA